MRKGCAVPNYGLIDLGSNSIRLVIYDVKPERKGAVSSKDFRSIINDKVMAGLAAYVDDGAFTAPGIEKAATVLRDHLKRADYFGCKRIDIFATAVLRNANNCADAIAEIEERIGTRITVLSGRDEAHLGFVGAACDRAIEEGVVVDIGGGSTELTAVENGRDYRNISIALGSLSAFTQNVDRILPNAKEMTAIEAAFDALFARVENAEAYRANTVYGIGGSVRAAAKMLAALRGAPARPKTLTPADVNEILSLCRTNPHAYSRAALRASAERIHTLTPGALILGRVLRHTGAEKLVVCKHGLREGYLIERMLG